MQPLAECKMPCTKDESGKWFPYSIDLTGQQIADVFFMGFRFTSTRGCDNTATYYIDDVTYGIETTAIQTVTTAEKRSSDGVQPRRKQGCGEERLVG